MIKIVQSQLEDLDVIFEFYDHAIQFQKKVYHLQWEHFEPDMVIQEINAGHQYKIMDSNDILGIFATAFDDEQFWKEKSMDPSIYLHRIVTHPNHMGKGNMKHILKWCFQYCKENELDYIRMDTWGNNERLIEYYKKCGFRHLKTIQLGKLEGLPIHYKGLLALLEMKVD